MKITAGLILTAMLILIATTAGAASRVEASNGSQASTCGATYTVQSGDYLSLIATNCGVAYADLLNANPNITNPDVVSAGQVINIPKVTSSSTTAAGSNATATAAATATATATAAAEPSALIPNTGNTSTSTPAGTATSGATSAAAAGGRTYAIQSGDTLSSIAQAYNVSLTDLINANPSITDADTIYAGQEITLPANASATPNSSATGTANNGTANNGVLIPNTGGTGNTYTVQSGDTLSAIAVQYNTTVTALVNANTDITNPDLIFPGQVINIR